MSMGAIHVGVINNQSELTIDRGVIVQAVRGVLEEASVQKARVSVVVVDDPTIHDLNRRFLEHDYPTDVLSFQLSPGPRNLEGEVIVSADTARSSAQRYGWSAWGELLLYVVHGTLHLVGYDDDTPKHQAAMRAQEQAQLAKVGLRVPYGEGATKPQGRRGVETRKREDTKPRRHKDTKGKGYRGKRTRGGGTA
jgi:probable rRNA maturation factor